VAVFFIADVDKKMLSALRHGGVVIMHTLEQEGNGLLGYDCLLHLHPLQDCHRVEGIGTTRLKHAMHATCHSTLRQLPLFCRHYYVIVNCDARVLAFRASVRHGQLRIAHLLKKVKRYQ